MELFVTLGDSAAGRCIYAGKCKAMSLYCVTEVNLKDRRRLKVSA